jgi:hypothetical protein
MGVAGVFGVLVGLVGLNGLAWHGAYLRERGLSAVESVGLALAALIVSLSGAVALAGYSLALGLGINLALLLGGVVVWLVRRAPPPDLSLHRWPNLAYGAALFAVFVLPAFALPVPFDTDAQGFGYLALMVKLGGTVNTLAPFYPEVHYLYSPGFFVLTAYLADLTGVPIHQVMLALAHASAGLTALLACDLGRVLNPGRRYAGPLTGLAITLGTGLVTTLMDSAYTSVLGLLFVTLFLVMLTHALSEADGRAVEIGLAGLALAAVPLSHPDTLVILLLAYLPFYATAWLARDMTWPRYRTAMLIVPALGVTLALPWLVRAWPLLTEVRIHSPFTVQPYHWRQLFVFHGVLIPALAVWGAVLALRRRKWSDVWALGWLVMVVDFGLFGWVSGTLARLGLDVRRYVYPFGVAWRGPILPYALLAGSVLDELAGKLFPLPGKRARLACGVGSLIGLAGLVALTIASPMLVRASKGRLHIYGAFSSPADVATMLWLRETSPPDARILNDPIDFEGHWAAVISQRDCIAFRDQLFFTRQPDSLARLDEAQAVYLDLASDEAREWIEHNGIDYVLIPQIVGEPGAFEEMQRWNPPPPHDFVSTPDQADYLELVFERDGAAVYRVRE